MPLGGLAIESYQHSEIRPVMQSSLADAKFFFWSVQEVLYCDGQPLNVFYCGD